MVRALYSPIWGALLLIALCSPAGCHLAFPFDIESTEQGPLSDSGPTDVADAAAGDSVDSSSDSTADSVPDSIVLAFDPPTPVTELNTPSGEDDPTLTGDMLEIYFERQNDIWRATRASTTALWSSVALVTELNSPEEDGTPDLASDGLTIFFASRSSRAAPWGAPALVPELNTADEDLCAAPAPDLLTVVLDSDRAGGVGARDLYLATRLDPKQPWGAPSALVGVNSSVDDTCPWIDVTSSLVLFSSARVGTGSGFNIWITTRSGPQASFSAPALVPGINSSSDDGDPWLSPDHKTIYFQSRRSGAGDIYVARRAP